MWTHDDYIGIWNATDGMDLRADFQTISKCLMFIECMIFKNETLVQVDQNPKGPARLPFYIMMPQRTEGSGSFYEYTCILSQRVVFSKE